MNKVNIKAKTVIWIGAAVIALLVIILSSIIIHNTSFILNELNSVATIDFEFIRQAHTERSFSIGLLVFSILIFSIGSYIGYAGIKSWNYNAIL
ncbi:hypothetical protein [Mycoplasmopsis columbinasalis]|uniref:Uncharacterized protein n=1 Tax=Mycoplasmopsis columbinasalis TaxID=114880 RepID=A0A449B9Q9_9BACT|nr:hypothetical protein [Mycoplasmopsis columbinasalis]VEU77909.1 Uncharacterised protein [Mycoplasmopsis columbinasalis]